MKGDGGFLVEDFINAITSQLDRVQDVLRLKAEVRPLTYALKDLALELQVFVALDEEGNVRFRTSGPNETGSSTVRLGFTTITKPMIEENTVSMAMTRSPLLDELGLDPEEQKRLEQIGVRNAAQLQRLGTSTGTRTISRLANVPIERLQEALKLGRPVVTNIRPAPTPPRPPAPKPPAPKPTPRPSVPVKPPTPRAGTATPSKPVTVGPPPPRPLPKPAPPVRTPPKVTTAPPFKAPPPRVPAAQPVKVAPGTGRLQLLGKNLIGASGVPEVKLNDVPLNVAEAEDDYLVVEIPHDAQSGALEVVLPDGQQLSYDFSLAHEEEEEALSYDGDEEGAVAFDRAEIERDLWEPEG